MWKNWGETRVACKNENEMKIGATLIKYFWKFPELRKESYMGLYSQGRAQLARRGGRQSKNMCLASDRDRSIL